MGDAILAFPCIGELGFVLIGSLLFLYEWMSLKSRTNWHFAPREAAPTTRSCYPASMSKAYKCPVCQNEVDAAATVCSNAACRAELMFCSHCRDISTYVLAEERKGKSSRNTYRCDRCQRLGVKCYTWLSGGYCNGMARAGGRFDRSLCSGCSGRVSEVSRSVIGWTLIGALGGLIKKN